MNSWASFKAGLNGALFFVWMGTAPVPLAAQIIPQKFLGDVTHPPSHARRFQPIQYKGATIRYDESAWEKFFIGELTATLASENSVLNLIVSGTDKKGRSWTVSVVPPWGIAPGYAWAADLDGDGTDELIFAMSQAGNGWCVGRWNLTTISFDDEGRPVPWSIEGFQHLDYDWETNKGSGILDFGDWNKNGRTELMQFDCESDSSQQVSEWYSIADVYELNQSVWQRVSQADRSKHESQYQKYAVSVQDELLPNEAGTFIPNYSNDLSAGVTARILTTVPAADGEGCGVLEGLKLEDGQLVELGEREKQQTRARCHDHFLVDDGVNCFGKPAIVVNSHKETVAVMNGSSGRAAELLEQIIREKLPVILTGQLEEGRCSPATIWAVIP